MATLNYKKELNEEQLKAVTHVDGPMLVLAGAGSGKTRCVTYRIVYLIEQGIPANSILGLTFTNKAAGEMRSRVEDLVGSPVLISTFHSLGAKILRESIHHIGYSSRFVIYDDEDIGRLIKKCIAELGIDEKCCDPKGAKEFISKAKDQMTPPEIAYELCQNNNEEHYPSIYRLYQEKMASFNALDFDDLLALTLKLFQKCPDVLERYRERWHYLLVDEYQDTNCLQYEIVSLLTGERGNLFVVGDPDQSIYSWRGANIDNILNFEKDFKNAVVVSLEKNYRSTNIILEASNALIDCNRRRYKKELWSDLGMGEKIALFTANDDYTEARFIAERIRFYSEEMAIPLDEIAILYRTNFQSRLFEDQLLIRSIPYKITGGLSFYQRKEIKDVIAYLKLSTCPTDFISFNRAVNTPKRGLGNVTIEKIIAKAAELNRGVIEICRNIVQSDPSSSPLALGTKAKNSLSDFIAAIDFIANKSEKCDDLGQVIADLTQKIGYFEYLKKEKESGFDREENIYELIRKARQWSKEQKAPSLHGFLEEMALRGQHVDELTDNGKMVNLMTLHNGKGLEFRLVFIAGLDNDLLPHANAKMSKLAIEEERRLLYVGMTRAKERLYLTRAKIRVIWGEQRFQKKSPFLEEIPEIYIQKVVNKRW